MGGETGRTNLCYDAKQGLSPRGRGNPTVNAICYLYLGSIPAWAGKPEISKTYRRRREVYPRVGGETGGLSLSPSDGGGLSPRGRGNPWLWEHRSHQGGSIPAWAGKPQTPGSPSRARRVYPRVGGET